MMMGMILTFTNLGRGAGNGNRTRAKSLGSFSSTIKLCPQGKMIVSLEKQEPINSNRCQQSTAPIIS